MQFDKEIMILYWKLFTDSCLDAVLDTLKILPFLFLAYLLIEILVLIEYRKNCRDNTFKIMNCFHLDPSALIPFASSAALTL